MNLRTMNMRLIWKRGGEWRAIRPILPFLLFVCGCAKISVDPTCPDFLRVGELGVVSAQATDPGLIPEYLWEVCRVADGGGPNAPCLGGGIQPLAARFIDPAAPQTEIQALVAGSLKIQLTASDGLSLVSANCATQATGTLDFAVALTAEPQVSRLDSGESVEVMLTCRNVGITEAANLEITQEQGDAIRATLVDEGPGQKSFTATRSGKYRFRCTATGQGEGVSNEQLAVVTIRRPFGSGNVNANQSQNANGNAGGNANANENGNANGNDNAIGNVNDNNANTNSNDNFAGNFNVNLNDNGTGIPDTSNNENSRPKR